ncbi:MAG: hypothetical protein ACYCZY_09790 [Lacisediminihabitans sp.]
MWPNLSGHPVGELPHASIRFVSVHGIEPGKPLAGKLTHGTGLRHPESTRDLGHKRDGLLSPGCTRG